MSTTISRPAFGRASAALEEAWLAARYSRDVYRYFAHELTPSEARARIAHSLAAREASFLDVMEHGIYANPASPYRPLLRRTGVELGDLAALVRAHGVEGALGELYAAGVYVSFEEFRGRRPIERGNLVLETGPRSFDNVLAAQSHRHHTGGSRGPRRVLYGSFEQTTHDTAYHSLLLEAFDVADRPLACWRPVPPGRTGLGFGLQMTKLGKRVARWFSQNRLEFRAGDRKEYLLTRYTLLASRRTGRPIPAPEHVPQREAVRVARWLAEQTAAGRPALLNTTASCGVRVCHAAGEHGLDIAGTFFTFGGEPLTPAKADVVAAAGARVTCNYAMAETGRLGIGCADGRAPDDVHVAVDKVAVIQRERPAGIHGASVGALLFTSLTRSARMQLLNVESDDYGVLERRRCACPSGELGLDLHLHTIRSYGKLTTAGMQFLGSELLDLVEEVLPARFGGEPGDYQLVERETRGLPSVALVVHPRVGALDEGELVRTVIERLGQGPSYKAMMAEIWRDADAVRVERREPYATGAGKLLPLHVLRSVDADAAAATVTRRGR